MNSEEVLRLRRLYAIIPTGGDDMKTITLDLCINGLKREGKAKMLLAVILAVWSSTMFTLCYDNSLLCVLAMMVIFLLVLILGLSQNKKYKKISPKNIYLVDDVFLRVSITPTWGKFVGRQECCVVDFAHHGTYEVMMHEETTEPENPSCDYSAVHFSKPGDEFYLLMLRDGEEERILKCFHKRFYVLSEEDFILTDGEYRPRSEVRR